jgi:hypothetical protein
VSFDAASSASLGRLSGTRLVEDPNYREMNLVTNNIYMRPCREQFPGHIARLVDHVSRDCDSLELSLDQIRQDTDLDNLVMGTGEPDVKEHFKEKIFPRSAGTLKRTDRFLMAKSAVLAIAGSNYKTSTPIPNMLYRYSRNGAFPEQQAQLLSMGTEMVINSQSLIYPFFIIEFKADGPSGPRSL